jgi:hypothetical protein
MVEEWDKELARQDVGALLAWQPSRVDTRLMEGAWLLQDRFRLSWGDASSWLMARLRKLRGDQG